MKLWHVFLVTLIASLVGTALMNRVSYVKQFTGN